MCRVVERSARGRDGGSGVRGGGCRLQQRRRLVDKAEKFVGADSAGPPEHSRLLSLCRLCVCVCVCTCNRVFSFVDSGQPPPPPSR